MPLHRTVQLQPAPGNQTALSAIHKLTDSSVSTHLESCTLQIEGPVQVARRSDMDMNGHINNVTYLGWALETVPADVYLNYSLLEVCTPSTGVSGSACGFSQAPNHRCSKLVPPALRNASTCRLR